MIAASRRLKQEAYHKFKVNEGCVVSPRVAWAIK